MPILNKVQKGQPITAELINNIIEGIRECQLQSVVGGYFRRGPGGTTITIQGKSQQSQVCPFDPTATQVTSGYNVSFAIGTVNGILPINMFSPITNVSTSSINYFYLKCSSDGKLITNVVIEKSTSLRNPQTSNKNTAPSEVNILLACMTTAGTMLKAIPCENISAKIIPTIQEDNVTYTAGERNFDQYYSWVF